MLLQHLIGSRIEVLGVFFDDIIVFSNILEENKEHLTKVFQELKEHKLYVNSKKS